MKKTWYNITAPWNGDCKDFEAQYEKTAEGLEGIINVGAVDMTTD